MVQIFTDEMKRFHLGGDISHLFVSGEKWYPIINSNQVISVNIRQYNFWKLKNCKLHMNGVSVLQLYLELTHYY